MIAVRLTCEAIWQAKVADMLKVITNRTGNVVTLRIQGRIVRGETDRLRTAVVSHPDASVIVLDLARVHTVDAGGLGLMLELREYAESRGVEFKLTNVTELVRRIIELTRLDSVFDVTYASESAARSSFVRFGSQMHSSCCRYART